MAGFFKSEEISIHSGPEDRNLVKNAGVVTKEQGP